MSAANVSLVQSLYAAFGRGDIATIVAAMAPDIVWTVNGQPQDFPTIGVWKGPTGAGEFFDLVAQNLDVVTFTPHEQHAVGDLVFSLGHYAWTVRKTGKPVAADWVHIFKIKGGKVTAFWEFTDTAQFAAAYR